MTSSDEDPADSRQSVSRLGNTEGVSKGARSEAQAPADHSSDSKPTLSERIKTFFDAGTFKETGPLRRGHEHGRKSADQAPHAEGVVTGWGRVAGRTVFLYAHDCTFGGALGEAGAGKIHKLLDLAGAAGAPVVGMYECSGARLEEGISALSAYGGILARSAQNSGIIPQISVLLGPCTGAAVYPPALADFVFMVRGTSQMCLAAPEQVCAATGEISTAEEIGGAEVHASLSGMAAFVYDDERGCLEAVQHLLCLLPSNNREMAPRSDSGDPADRRCSALLDLVPFCSSQAYDVRGVIEEVVDHGAFLEVHASWAQNLVCALARLGGRSVGVIANQPAHLAGALDIQASDKGARFVQLCDAFNLPLVTLIDTPGFLPGVDQEHEGVARHGAKLIHAYCNATVPRVSLVVRKSHGIACVVMDSRSTGCDVALAWPSGEFAVINAENATSDILPSGHNMPLDPKLGGSRTAGVYGKETMPAYYAAECGLLDDVIDPADTRIHLISALGMLRARHAPLADRKHGNGPI